MSASALLIALMLAALAAATFLAPRLLAVWLAAIPAAFALLMGISPLDVGAGALSGATGILETALLLYALLAFFGAAGDEGLFEWLARLMLGRGGGTATSVYLRTAAVGLAAGLSGSPAVAYTVTLSCLRPAYVSRGLDLLDLALLASLSMGVSLAWPWAAKTLILAGMAGVSAADLWVTCLPMQAAGALILFGACGVLGLRGRGKRAPAGRGSGPEGARRSRRRPVPDERCVRAGAASPRPPSRRACLCLAACLVLAVVMADVPHDWAAVFLIALAVLASRRVWEAPVEGAREPEPTRRRRLRALLAAARRSLPRAGIVFQTLAVGMFTNLSALMLRSSPELLGLVGSLPAGSSAAAAWAFGAFMAAAGVVVPYQLVYAVLPVLLAAGGAAPAMLVAPLVPMYSSTVSPSVPSTALIDESLGLPRGSHVRRNAVPVCLANLAVLAAGLASAGA